MNTSPTRVVGLGNAETPLSADSNAVSGGARRSLISRFLCWLERYMRPFDYGSDRSALSIACAVRRLEDVR
jgi:hypothetical protein